MEMYGSCFSTFLKQNTRKFLAEEKLCHGLQAAFDDWFWAELLSNPIIKGSNLF